MIRADEVKAVIKGPIEQDKPEDLDGLVEATQFKTRRRNNECRGYIHPVN